ncbi:MAG: hypothetical protein J6C90_01160 [Clostridia bacterium]|nr:hypothetical protein [Clostridia bacterium]
MTTTQERIAYVKKHSPRNADSTVAMLEDLPTAKANHIKHFGSDSELKSKIDNIDANILYCKLIGAGMSKLGAEMLLCRIIRQTDYASRSLDTSIYTQPVAVR